jgi:imidazolonepropionase-like amidohydrolase
VAQEHEETVQVVRPKAWLDPVERRVYEGMELVVADGRIEAIRPATSGPATEIDGYLLPGFIDCHVHLFGVEARNEAERLLLDPLDGILETVEAGRRMLRAGFTTVRDVGSLFAPALDRAIRRGYAEGPRIVFAGAVLSQTGGHGDAHSVPLDLLTHPAILQFSRLCDGPDDCRKAVREQLRRGAGVIKICTTGGVWSERDLPTETQFTLDEVRAIVDEASRVGRKVAAHAQGTDGIRLALDGGVASIEHGYYLTEELADRMAKGGVFLVPTLTIGSAVAEDGRREKLPAYGVAKSLAKWDRQLESFRMAVERGVPIALGTDVSSGEVTPPGLNGHEFSLMARFGMAPWDAIRAGTVQAAELLGVAGAGRLGPGSLADMVAVAEDPLAHPDSLERPIFVSKGGRVVTTDGGRVAALR